MFVKHIKPQIKAYDVCHHFKRKTYFVKAENTFTGKKKEKMKKQLLGLVCCLLALTATGQLTNFVGIGARLQLDSTSLGYPVVKIIAFIPGGSAEHSALKVGDFILKVDDKTATRLPLSDVVAMIMGEEGTKVKMEVKQGAAIKTLTLVRKKVQATSLYYTSEVNSEFGTAITKLLNDAAYNFEHVWDSTSFEQEGEGFGGKRIYRCTVQVPGTEKTVIQSSFGLTCRIKIGTYQNEDQVNKGGEAFVEKLKACFPKFYFFSKSIEGNGYVLQVGQKNDKGYYGASMVIYPMKNKTSNQTEMFCRIENGVPQFFYTIEAKAKESEFGAALNKIYDDILNKFENIKTTEHISDDTFNESYWYDINVKVPYAHNYYVDAGSLMSIRADECIANFYLGDNKEDAAKTFSALTDPIMEAFGSDFVFTGERPHQLLESIIPEKAEKFVIFTRKKERSYESLGVCALVMNQESDGRYRVYITFHKTGM